MASERQKVNIVSFLVAAGILCVAVELSSGSFATRINKISENLDRALSEVMDDKRPEFTNLTDNATYVSDTYFNPKGMAGLYNFTNAFIDVVFSKNVYPEGEWKVCGFSLRYFRSERRDGKIKFLGISYFSNRGTQQFPLRMSSFFIFDAFFEKKWRRELSVTWV